MNTLKLSDLFRTHGTHFDFEVRMKDQEELVKRLEAFPELAEHAADVREFCHEHIASIVYIEYMLENITHTCAQENIPIS